MRRNQTLMKFIKSIKPEFAIACVLAVAAFIALIAGKYGRNPYFTVAAGALVLATYVTCPPYWAVELTQMVIGKRSGKQE